MMYYIIYVFQGAGLISQRGNFTADSVQYMQNHLSACKMSLLMRHSRRRTMKQSRMRNMMGGHSSCVAGDGET